MGNYVVPKGIDDGAETATGVALAINVALLGVFGLQHSIMARPAFKRVWTKLVPQPIERATYCLASSACLILLYWAWRPMPGIVWDFTGTPLEIVMRALFFGGWGLVLASSFMIDHFDLFGLRQAWLYFQGKEYAQHPFSTPFLYKYVRPPLPRLVLRVLAHARDDERAPAVLVRHDDVHRGGLSRALLGSTAEKLVRIAKVPTLTIRPK